MKRILIIFGVVLATTMTHAASDTDVAIIKADSVVIEHDVITIIAEANVWLIFIRGDHDAASSSATWRGRPSSRTHIKADKATFVIRRPKEAGLHEAWKTSLKAAKDLQNGMDVGRIGYYEPDVSIKRNLIDSITGFGFLYPKGQ